MKRFLINLVSFLSFGLVIAQSTLSSNQVLSNALSQITESKGIEVQFNISNAGFVGNGKILMSGSKYNVSLPDGEIWYNGNEMYTYNKNSGETTLTIPSAEEISESNPLAYITGAKNNYNVSYSTVKKAGRFVLELTPKSKQSEIKRITLTLKKTDYTPEKIVVEPKNGNPITAEINSFHKLNTISPGAFEYPKSKYPKVEIVDLR